MKNAFHSGGQRLRFGVLSADGELRDWQAQTVSQLLAIPEVEEITELRAAGSALASCEDHPDTVARVREARPDFLLSFAPVSVSRSLRSLTELGVWQFFFGDSQEYGCESLGFWEIHDDATVAVAYLAQLRPTAAPVRVLQEGAIRAHAFSAARTRRELLACCVRWPAQVCLELLSGDRTRLEAAEPLQTPTRPPRKITPAARFRQVLRGGWRIFQRQVRASVRHQQWNVGLLEAPIQTLLQGGSMPAVRWLGRPKRNEFLADPFGIEIAGRLTVLCEYLHYRNSRGVIVALSTEDQRDIQPAVIGPPVHLSYPYLLQEEGRIYCVPETSAAGEIAIYECVDFPTQWKRVTALVSGASLVDATLLFHSGRWWMFAATPAAKGADCELHLWLADKLLGPWYPHPGNPVKVDVRSARPAGTPFVENGVIYRPAQDNSREYGKRIVINRIATLTPTAFREIPHAVIEAGPNWPYRAGLHTLSAVGQRTLVDARRDVFSPYELWRIVLPRWNRNQ